MTGGMRGKYSGISTVPWSLPRPVEMTSRVGVSMPAWCRLSLLLVWECEGIDRGTQRRPEPASRGVFPGTRPWKTGSDVCVSRRPESRALQHSDWLLAAPRTQPRTSSFPFSSAASTPVLAGFRRYEFGVGSIPYGFVRPLLAACTAAVQPPSSSFPVPRPLLCRHRPPSCESTRSSS